MMYEKPEVDVLEFDKGNVFMTASGEGFSSAGAAAKSRCTVGFSDELAHGGKVQCSSFGGYNNIPNGQHAEVVIGNHLYIFDHVGNHWKCSNYH